MRRILETAHAVAEMAGGAAVAAVLRQRRELAGKRGVCPVSGGNATLQQFGGLFR